MSHSCSVSLSPGNSGCPVAISTIMQPAHGCATAIKVPLRVSAPLMSVLNTAFQLALSAESRLSRILMCASVWLHGQRMG
jgi:hypothetical protein